MYFLNEKPSYLKFVRTRMSVTVFRHTYIKNDLRIVCKRLWCVYHGI